MGLRIVYMGTPDFAVPGLKTLVENGYEIAGVVTAPDKPKGRGKKIQCSEVKKFASEIGLRLLQPVNLKSEEFISELQSINADLFIVVAFRMLPEKVWNMPRLGTFNLHASLLPHYRGAAPIHWAVINGEKETGLTTFFLKHQIDTGDIILQEKEVIQADDTTGTLYSRLMEKGGAMILNTVKLIEQGNYTLLSQDGNQTLKEAPKIHKETTEINWDKSAREICNFVRGLNPFPSAWSMLKGKYYKIHSVRMCEKNLDPGQIKTDGKSAFVGCMTGSVELIEVQPEGKRRMKVSEFLAGNEF